MCIRDRFITPAPDSRTAWGATFYYRAKDQKPSTPEAAIALLDKTLTTALSEGATTRYDETRQVKGVDKSLPTPAAQQMGDIKGTDITIDLDAKPIRVYSKSEAAKLEPSFQRYWFEIHPRYKRRLHLLRDELAAARSLKDLVKVLTRENIKHDYRIYMDPMYQ